LVEVSKQEGLQTPGVMNTFIRTKQHKEKKKRTAQKNNNIQPSLHIHQTSGTANQPLNTAVLASCVTLLLRDFNQYTPATDSRYSLCEWEKLFKNNL